MIRISSNKTEIQWALPYIINLFRVILVIGIIAGLIIKGGEGYTAAIILAIFQIALTTFYQLSKKPIGIMKMCDLSDNFIILSSSNKTKEKVLLENIISIEYSWYPPPYLSETSIIIKYTNSENKINQALIIPTQLDERKKFKINRQIFKLLLDQINIRRQILGLNQL
jgi:hypothetical protein